MRENPEGDPALSVPSVALSGAVVSFFRGRPRVFFFCVLGRYGGDVMVGTLWWWRFFFAIWDVMVENLMKGTEQKKYEFNIKKGNL